VRSSAKGAMKGQEREGGLRKSWRGDGEQVLVEEGGREVARWRCNHCGALFKKEAGMHIHATRKHHGEEEGDPGSKSPNRRRNPLNNADKLCVPHQRDARKCSLCDPRFLRRVSVSMGEYALNAKSAGAAPFASMGDNALGAKSVGAPPYVSMGENALSAKSADSERSQLPVAPPCRTERSLCDAKDRVDTSMQ